MQQELDGHMNLVITVESVTDHNKNTSNNRYYFLSEQRKGAYNVWPPSAQEVKMGVASMQENNQKFWKNLNSKNILETATR